jgi:hypothetical protein
MASARRSEGEKNKMTTRAPALLAVLTLLGACIVYGACGDDSSAVKEPPPDAGGTSSSGTSGNPIVQEAGSDGEVKDCVENPTTHLEIINACTNATRVPKSPTLTKLLSDGGLPPLQ